MVTVTVTWVVPTEQLAVTSATSTRTTPVRAPASRRVRQQPALVAPVDSVPQMHVAVPAATFKPVT